MMIMMIHFHRRTAALAVVSCLFLTICFSSQQQQYFASAEEADEVPNNTNGICVSGEEASCTSFVYDSDSKAEDPHLDRVKRIYEWVNKASTGYVTAKQTVQRMEKGNLNTPLIVIATADIKEGELLVKTPWEYILQSDNSTDDDEKGWYCGTTRTLAKEMKLGSDSLYAPYVQYLTHEPNNQLPTQYSPRAKHILNLIVGFEAPEVAHRSKYPIWDAYHQRIPPSRIHTTIENSWYGACGGDRADTVSAKAATMVIQRADDTILIPAYDAYNHRNGEEYLNAQTDTEKGEYHRTNAIRDIEKGEQIYISYNLCSQCGGRAWYGFGTSEMFRDYGFVEWFPQRWYYPGYGDYDAEQNTMEVNQFDLYWYEDYQEEEETGLIIPPPSLEIVWTHLTYNKPKLHRFRMYLRNELKRLKRIKNITFRYNFHTSKITEYEWSNMKQFLEANIIAMTVALDDLTLPIVASQLIPYTRVEQLLGEGDHYDSLLKAETDADLSYEKQTCDNREHFEFTGYTDTESNIHTYYYPEGGISYMESFWFNKQQDEIDVCADIDDIIQVCSSYRPYSHEYLVHMAARYVPTIKRVLFVGGGDSMVLHEVLKYGRRDDHATDSDDNSNNDNELELIVGLELDQTVTRKSFKHFQTDPYFNDERVQWWFGDVRNSLLMLPESYWGSFDMVIVDLSEMSLSMSATKEMQLFETLQLLLNPDTGGVLVKNDLYLSKLAKLFDYTMELHLESPVICSQTLVLASDTIDFFHAPIYDHGITEMNNLVYTTSLDGPDNRHEFMHDYRTRSTATSTHKKKTIGDKVEKADEKKKKDGDDDNDDDNKEQTQTTGGGILQIVNAENSSLIGTMQGTLDINNIAKLMKDALTKVEGFTFEKGNGDDDGDGDGTTDINIATDQGLCLFVFNEGYIAVRIFARDSIASNVEERSYVGFDINLWTKTHRIDELKSALLQAVGSTDVSSYRIVVGGMYGTSSWKDDLTNVGIPLPSVMPEKEEEQKKWSTADPKIKKEEESSNNNSLDDDAISAVAFDEVVSLTLSKDVIAVVVCGKESESGSCTSLTVLKNHKHVKEVIPIYECPISSVVDDSDGNGEDNSNNNKVHTRIEKIYDCEMKITEELKTKLGSSNRKIQLLVLDDDASYGMHRIMNSIFDTYVNRGVLLHTHSIAVTWSSSSSSSSSSTTKKKEPWRREFLERYRKQIHHDPVKLGEIVIYSSKDGDEKGSISKSSSLSSSSSSSPCLLRVVSTNNVNVNYEFDRLEQRLRNRLNNAESGSGTNVNVKVELRKIHGGLYNYKEKGGSHKPPKVFYQKDYNNTSALEHFQNQVIVGRQYIFQYEIDPALKKLKDAEESLKTLSFDDVDQIVQAALISKVDNLIDLSEQEQDSTIHVRYPIGEGGVYFTSHGRFNVIAVWDGRDHVAVNLFAFEDLFEGSSSADGNDTTLQLQDTVNVRIQELSVLKDVAIDIQPRGYGHVINFPEDLVPRETPLDPYLDPDDYEDVEEDEEEEDDDEEDEEEDLDEEEYDNEEHDEDEDLDEEEEDDEEYYDEDEDDEDEYEELPSSEGEL